MNLSALLALLQNPSALGLILKAPQLFSMIKEGPKPGVTTTEFWITTVISAWLMFAPGVPPEIAGIAVPILAGAYTLARAITKGLHAAGKAPDVTVPELTDEQKKALGIS